MPGFGWRNASGRALLRWQRLQLLVLVYVASSPPCGRRFAAKGWSGCQGCRRALFAASRFSHERALERDRRQRQQHLHPVPDARLTPGAPTKTSIEALDKRLAAVNVGSLAIGLLAYFGESEDADIADLRREIRRLEWWRVPRKLRDMDHETLRRHFDEATWRVIKQRLLDSVSPVEALIRGAEGELWKFPGEIGNALRPN